MRLFAGDEAGEDEHGAFYAGLADGDAFFGAGDAEPIVAKFFKGLGDLRSAVAVTIAFDDAQHFSRRGAIFAGRIDVRANRVQIELQRAERNFGPDRPALKINFLFVFGLHANPSSFNFTPSPHSERSRQNRGARKTTGTDARELPPGGLARING